MATLDFSILEQREVEGRVSRFELPAVLLRVVREKRSGCLTLVDGDRVRTVTFAAGLPTSAGSLVPSERLGQRLLKLDLISAEQSAQVDALMCSEPVQFGEAMLRLHFMHETELRRTLRTHHNWILAQSLAASELQCSFAPNAWVAPDPSGLALMQAIEDGVRAYGSAVVSQLLAHARSWAFAATQDDVELLRSLGASSAMIDMAWRLAGRSFGAADVVASGIGDETEVMSLTLLLSGVLHAVPGERPVATELTMVDASAHVSGQQQEETHASRSATPAAALFLQSTPPPSEGALADEPALPSDSSLSVFAKACHWMRQRSAAWGAIRLYVVAAGILVASLVIIVVASRHSSNPVKPVVTAAPQVEPPEPTLVIAPPKGPTAASEAASSTTGPASPASPPVPENVGAAASPMPPAQDLPGPSGSRERPSTAALRETESPTKEPATVSSPSARSEPKRPAPRGAAATTKATRRPATSPGGAESKDEIVTENLQACAKFFQQGNYQESVRACQRVLAANPRHALAYRYLGIAYAKLGMRAQACESYRRYLRYGDDPPDRPQVEALLQACD